MSDDRRHTSGPARRGQPPSGRARARAVHLGPVGQRVPPHQGGGLPPPGLRDGFVDLPHGHPDPEVGPEPGADQAHRGHVQRPGAGHDPHGGGGRRARSRRRGRGPARRELLRVGQGRRRVHRRGHRGQGRERCLPPQCSGKPFTSDLSGQDFWTLMQTGHIPQGLVMGTCVYHIAHRGLGATLGSAGQNVELPNFTQALYEARELAMTRMQDEANELGAVGHRRGPAGGEVPPVGLATPSSSSRSAPRWSRPPTR